MTRKQFEQLSTEIQKEKFETVTEGPIQFAIARAKFRQKQIKELIEAGRKVSGSKTVAAKVKRYERQLTRLEPVPERFLALLENRATNRL